jgi:hypothetical protein
MHYECQMNRYEDQLEKEIEKQRGQALVKFASIVSDSSSIDVIARLVAAGSLEENPDALKIIDKLNIDKLEILSLVDDEFLFKKQYEQEIQWSYESDLYYDQIIFRG